MILIIKHTSLMKNKSEIIFIVYFLLLLNHVMTQFFYMILMEYQCFLNNFLMLWLT